MANYDFTYTGAEIQAILDTAKKLKDSGYIFLGVATPSTNPGTPTQKVYYEAKQAGTYTNFGGAVLPDGLSLLIWNGSWTSETMMSGDGGVYDISVYKSTGGTLAKYTDLAAALGTNGANIPQSLRKGGMSVKFVQSSDNNYVQARCISETFSINPEDWDVSVENFISDSSEWLYVVVTSTKQVLGGFKVDGSFEYIKGVPTPIKQYIENLHLENKVDKEEGKGLIIIDFANMVSMQESDEFIDVITDVNERFCFGINKDGDVILKNNLNLNKKLSELSAEIFSGNKRLLCRDKIHKSYGVNTHFMNCDLYAINGIIPSMMDAGIFSIRSGESFSSQVNLETGDIDWTNWDEAHFNIYKYSGWANKVDILSMIAHGNAHDSEDSTPIPVYNNWQYKDLWLHYIDELVKRGDGRGISYASGTDGTHETVPYKCEYYEICNELNVYFSQGLITLEDWFTIQRIGYEAVKNANPNAKVLFGGTSGPVVIGGDWEGLFQLTYNDDGVVKHIWDYFDIFNYHYYAVNNPISMYDSIRRTMELLDKYNICKPVWVTESGYTTLEITEQEQAKRTPLLYLQCFAYGVERFFNYQCKAYEITSNDRESYFGIIHNSQRQTRTEFIKNDGSGIGINNIETLYVSLYSGDTTVLNLTNTIVNNLKATGLKITVKRGNISVVSINDTPIYTAAGTDIEEVTLSASLFASITTSDVINVKIINGNTSKEWLTLDAKPAYHSIKHLYKMLPDGSSVPNVVINNNIHIYSWTDVFNQRVKALYSDSSIKVQVELNKDATIYDYMGNILPYMPDTLNGGEIIYIHNVKYFNLL